MHVVEVWLQGLPPILVYLIVTLVIGLESMGVPLPGEIALVAASLMAVNGITNPYAVAIAASIGAITGDSIGYLIGRRGGRRLLERFGRRFPNHFGPPHLAKAEQLFDRWGVWAVFIGRFIALLRILAGPLAGALRIPYRRFLAANAAGGIVWSFGTTFLIYGIGQAAEKWLSRFSWVALAVAVVCGIVTTLWLRRRAARHMAEATAGDKDDERPGEKEEHAPAALGSDS